MHPRMVDTAFNDLTDYVATIDGNLRAEFANTVRTAKPGWSGTAVSEGGTWAIHDPPADGGPDISSLFGDIQDMVKKRVQCCD